MKGDFTRDTFDHLKHFSRVLMQQGRVQLDADFNEQASILLYHLRALTADLLGNAAGPADCIGFQVLTKSHCAKTPGGTTSCDSPAQDEKPGAQKNPSRIASTLDPNTLSCPTPVQTMLGCLKDGDFLITPGRYYVDGILCENDQCVTYLNQPDLVKPEALLEDDSCKPSLFLVYLDVWERHITWVEDGDIREVGLKGPDTSTRARIVWQVKVEPLTLALDDDGIGQALKALVSKCQPNARGSLKARVQTEAPSADPCTLSPASRYRGLQNQLYRVEIHTGGKLCTPDSSCPPPTFKWSRENGSVIFPIVNPANDTTSSTKTLTLANLGRDAGLSLSEGDRVEVVDDAYALANKAESLRKVVWIDRVELKVGLDEAVTVNLEAHPLLRRWDQQERNGLVLATDGAVRIVESNNDKDWTDLEDGVQIQFQPGGNYRTGDYWLIPARTETGDIEWPRELRANGSQVAKALPPRGIDHHIAPLAVVSVDSCGAVNCKRDCRNQFEPLGSLDLLSSACDCESGHAGCHGASEMKVASSKV